MIITCSKCGYTADMDAPVRTLDIVLYTALVFGCEHCTEELIADYTIQEVKQWSSMQQTSTMHK